MEITTTHYIFDDDTNSCLQRLQTDTIPEVDQYIFWISGSLVFLATSFLLIGAIRFKALRRQPGDLIIGIAFSEWILAIQWLIQASYPDQVKNEAFCVTIGAIGTFGGVNEFMYTACFSLFLIITLRKVLNQGQIHSKVFHGISFVVTLAYLIAMLLFGKIGRNIIGTCSIKFECDAGFDVYGEIFFLVFASIYTLLGCFTFFYVRRNISSCQRVSKKRAEFLNYYMKYNLAASVTYFIVAITNILIIVVANDGSINLYSWANSIYNIAKLGSILFLTVMRYRDPTVKKYMLRTLFFWRQRRTDILDTIFLSGTTGQNANGTTMHESFKPSDDDDDDLRFDRFTAKMKMGLTYTILSGILYANKVRISDRHDSIMSHNRRAKGIYKQEKVLLLEEKSIFADIPGAEQELIKQGQNIFPGTFKVYAPDVFAGLLEQDHEFINIANSLDLRANKDQIEKAGQAQGGRGGGFFVFSTDRKLILKTITSEELKVTMNMLKKYDDHLNDNPSSLIAKIYGVYTYENTDLGITLNMMLLRNVCGFPSKFVRRTYDLKGSTFQRVVLKPDQVLSEEEMRKIVLKDLDFERKEQKLSIIPQYKQAFLNQITADAQFFRTVNVIDYSFMVFIVNKTEAFEQEIDPHSDFTANPKNSLSSIMKSNEPGIYYNMGIIDYLQPFNTKKKLERCIKRFRNMNRNLDTSVQGPVRYSERFITFIKKIVETDASIDNNKSIVYTGPDDNVF